MSKAKIIFTTMSGVIIGLIVSILLLVIKSTAKDFLKTYSLDWVIDVLLFLIFIVIVLQYIPRVQQRLGKQNASRPLMQKGRETFGHTSGVYLGARMDA